MKTIALILFISLLYIHTPNQPSSSSVCGCPGEPSTTDEERRAAAVREFTRASAVFSGEVVEFDMLKTKVKVDRLWKGEKTEEINMVTGAIKIGDDYYGLSSCDYHFKVGKKYLIYAYETALGLKTHACSRTRPIEYAEQEMEELEEFTPREKD